MHPCFAAINFGPFQSDYHAIAVDSRFREALSTYLASELLPQVDKPFESTSGSLNAVYDNQKYCGPNSAVRDLYRLEFHFHRASGDDAIKIDLAYSPSTQSFRPRYRGKKLFLWTETRKEKQKVQNIEIEHVCQLILRGEMQTANCPCCGNILSIINSPSLFDVSCSQGCFNYNFHRDPETGKFQNGHFFSGPR